MSSSSPPRPSQVETPHIEPQALVSHYTTRLLRPLRSLLASSFGSPRLLNWLWRFYTRGSPARTRRRKPGLPIPLPPGILASLPAASEAAEVAHLLDDVLDHVLSSLHNIQKNLQFWQSRAEGSDAKKIYFMVFEKGPQAFIKESVQLITRYRTQGYSMQSISLSAAVSFSNKINVLTRLQYHLATFLAQIYLEIDRYGELLANDPAKALPALTLAVARLFSNLEDSMRGSAELLKSDPSIPSTSADELGSCDALSFVNLPDHLYETSSWSHNEVRDAVNSIYQNLQKLDSHISLLVSKCQKPRRMTLYWLRYTCGAVGLSACSIWLLRHSSLMGSSDIDNWICEAKESTAGFWRSHVEQPVLAIRDELFETFRRRHKGVIEVEEVKLTEDSLRRMLLVFCEQTKGQKFPGNASDQEMMEIVMSRYEKELMHPIQNLFSGEIARALLIQIQKLKLDLETAMLELDQILKANEINFAILAALPAFFLSVFFLMLARTWILQDKGAEGRGKIARLQRRLLVAEVEKRIMRLETCIEERQEEDAQCMFGLVLYSLDRLYKAVERHAKEAGEWQSLKQDIIDIGNPRIRTAHKLVLASRMARIYDSMLPSLKQH